MDMSRSKRKEEVSVLMEVSKSHGSKRRSRDTDVTSSGSSKRRRFYSRDQGIVVEQEYQHGREFEVDLSENVVSSAVSDTSDRVSSFLRSNNASSLDLKAKSRVQSLMYMASNGGFSGETTTLSNENCLDSEEMESSSSSTCKKNKQQAAQEAATSRRKQSTESKIPSAAEIEEFFFIAEKHEQKRFADKYNYDTVNDVPIEGRYQWVRLKP